MEGHQSVELIASVYHGAKSTHAVRLLWDDEAGTNNEKTTYHYLVTVCRTETANILHNITKLFPAHYIQVLLAEINKEANFYTRVYL